LIEFLKGRLISAVPGNAVLEIGDIGIALQMPPAEDYLSSLVGQDITLYTRLLIKEDEVYIFGFRAAEERKLFNLILSVSGFGPRLALSLLGIFTVSQFYVAVLEENIPQLCRAHGVGRKAAQRLVLEIKEKLPKVISTEDLAVGPVMQAGSSVYEDLTAALNALGYSSAEASAAVSKAIEHNKDLSREDLLKLVLKGMAQK